MSSPRTYWNARNNVKYVHPSFDLYPHALTQVHTSLWNVHTLYLKTIIRILLRCAQNYNLMPTSHQPKCKFTFLISTNDSPSCMYNYEGFILGTLHSPPPYFCIVLNASYKHVHIKFKKSSKISRYFVYIASFCSQVESLGPYQVHWTLLYLWNDSRVVWSFGP